jgi:hypothetical protein
MTFTEGDRLVIVASLQWAAMAHERMATKLAGEYKMAEAKQRAAFSSECVRLAEALRKGR